MSLAGDAASGPCQDFVQLQSKFPGDNPTDAQIQSVLNANGRPSPRYAFTCLQHQFETPQILHLHGISTQGSQEALRWSTG